MAKVLLVEDDNNLRDIYQARLAAEGYEISTAQDGEEALVVAKQTKPDLVVSDVMMPKISGFEMLDILRNTPGLEHVKVIMLTALGQSEDRDRADSLGADKYLVKSQVTLEDIVKTAHELLGEDDAATPPPAVAADLPTPSTTTTESVPMEPAPEPMAVEPAPEPAPAAEPTAAPTAPPAQPAPSGSTDALAAAAASLGGDMATDTAPVTAPEPADDLSAPAQPDTTTATNEASLAGSTAQEQAAVAEQISDFEQTTTPAEPTADPAPEEPSTTTDTPLPTPAEEAASAATTDDQLMADAANELAGSVSDNENDIAKPVTSTEEVATPAEPTEPAQAALEANDAAKEEAEKTNISISGKKVIQPLDSQPKPDINELLAREEAASGNVVTGAAVIADAEAEEGEPKETEVDQAPAIVHQPGESFAPQSAPTEAPTTSGDEDRPSGAPAPAPSEKKDGQGFDPNSVAL